MIEQDNRHIGRQCRAERGRYRIRKDDAIGPIHNGFERFINNLIDP